MREATPAAESALRAISISAGRPFGTIPSDGFAYFSERGARRTFHVCDLAGGAGGVSAGREQAACEFRLEHDDGERVPEHIVKVARDAFAFREGCQLLDFLVCKSQAGVGTLLLRDERIRCPHDDDEETVMRR